VIGLLMETVMRLLGIFGHMMLILFIVFAVLAAILVGGFMLLRRFT